MYLSPKGSVSAYSIIFVEPALKLDVTHFCPSRPTCTSRGCDLGGRDFRNSGRGRLRVAWCARSIEGSRTCPSTKISTLKLSAFCAMTAVGRRPRAPTVTRSGGCHKRKGKGASFFPTLITNSHTTTCAHADEARVSRYMSKRATAIAAIAFACCTFSVPFVLAGGVHGTSLYASEKPLDVAAVRRGAFMNSGSKDIGSSSNR